MTTEQIERVRTRKNEAVFARKRERATRKLRDTESKPQRDAEALYARRFALAWRWVELHVLGGPADVTQVGRDGFYWKRPCMIEGAFETWDESARIALEVTP